VIRESGLTIIELELELDIAFADIDTKFDICYPKISAISMTTDSRSLNL